MRRMLATFQPVGVSSSTWFMRNRWSGGPAGVADREHDGDVDLRDAVGEARDAQLFWECART
jgi:hypothetical protein